MTLFVELRDRLQRVRQFGFFLLWVGVTAVGIFLHPSASGHGTHEQLGLPACPSVLFLDRPCPGCGLTTSWTATIHGRFGEAFQAHPLGPLMYVLFSLGAWVCLVGCFKSRAVDTGSTWFNRGLTAFVVVFLAFGVWRFATHDHFATLGDRMSVGLR